MTLLAEQPRWATTRPPTRLTYLPGVDGLRALSVVAVLAYHLDASWADGGYLGVEVFFVVSGFLITSLLLAEHRETGRVDLPAFWLRRARRLLPAVYVLIALVSAWALVAYDVGELRSFRADAFASLFYVQNWHAIVADIPYFQAFGRPSPFRHLWSLAIEEQFYLCWPLLVPLGLRFLSRRWTSIVVAAGAVTSIALLGSFGDIAAPDRAYFGTDTRVGGLLVGAVLAFWWRPDVVRDAIGRSARHVVELAGVAGLAALAWLFATRSEYDPWTFPWGFVTIDIATLVVIVAATHPGARLGRLVGAGPLQAIGRRSYSIYLWHWPVIVSTRPGVDTDLDGPALLVVRLALVAVLTEASYRLVEKPFRARRDAAVARPSTPATANPGWIGAALAAVLVGAVLVSAPGFAAPESAAADFVLERAPIEQTTTTTTPASTTTAPPATTPPTTVPAAVVAATAPRPVPDVTMLGESVTLGAAQTLLDYYGERIQIDAVEGRRYEDDIQLLEGLASVGRLTPWVIVHFGTNGAVPAGGLERIVDAVGPDRTLVLVTVRVPQRWESQVNDEISRVAAEHANIVVADWYRLTVDEPGLLVRDGVHLTSQGMIRYRDLLVAITG